MPISSVTTDYSNRTLDVSILATPNPSLPGVQPVTATFGIISSFCAGVQKLIQRYAIMLLTVQGSQPNYPTFGTNFLQILVQQSSEIDQLTVHHLFNFANIDVLSTMKAYQATLPSTAPLDEQIDTAQLVSIQALPTSVNFTIKITTLAGTSVPFVLPLPTSL